MLLDIIIPVYNVNSYICQCIDSVINIPDVNILVINDGSKEDASFLKDCYSKFSNFYYYEKENGGLSSARNYGINRATSEYIMFLDGDDFIVTEELQKAIESLKLKKTKVSLYFFRYFWEEQNRFEKERMLDCYYSKAVRIEDITESKGLFPMVAWRYIIDRRFILRNNLYFKEGIFHEDEEWSTRLWCFAEKINILNYFVYNYRQREGSISSNYTVKHLKDLFYIIKCLDNFSLQLKDNNKLQLVEFKKKEMFRESCVRSINLTLDNKERREYTLLYKDVIKKIAFNNKIIKWVPYWLMRLLLKIRQLLRRCIL